MANENKSMDKVKELSKAEVHDAQVKREKALLGDLEGHDAEDRAKRDASRKTKEKEMRSGNDTRDCSR